MERSLVAAVVCAALAVIPRVARADEVRANFQVRVEVRDACAIAIGSDGAARAICSAAGDAERAAAHVGRAIALVKGARVEVVTTML